MRGILSLPLAEDGFSRIEVVILSKEESTIISLTANILLSGVKFFGWKEKECYLLLLTNVTFFCVTSLHEINGEEKAYYGCIQILAPSRAEKKYS